MASLLILVSGLASLASCTDPQVQEWSQEEKANAVHFIKAVSYSLEAIGISNAGGPGVLPEADRNEILRLNRAALHEASLLWDTVLDKAHPELRHHLREEWQRGLELRVRNLESGDFTAERLGSKLLDKWGDWFVANRKSIRIPKP